LFASRFLRSFFEVSSGLPEEFPKTSRSVPEETPDKTIVKQEEKAKKAIQASCCLVLKNLS
jgi:hypothetical protein